ncbi:pali-domain-containing protein [Calocera cornea HHB12733]|uniref:Pali-domain-containing protein n=1 Tax=Calocera cornea HHB12733 TaxID=1353952 RepID=A0A165ETY7_9BASI|nr:pali-domain-containing protein [Calocera cornea HHB12733]
MCLRPATPGFLITLAATVCLVIVVFSVPWLKTVYFLKASLAAENMSGDVIFGTLGYCLELPGNTTCTSPKVGYQFDASQLNELLGLDGAIQIPSLFVSWLTYPLVLHVVGLILAAISALFGLLAHVREMSMTCLSTCFSGFAATVVLIAFIFDLVIFFLARARLNSVSGGSASIGNGVWLTLAAWVLLFFAGCAFGFGRCCITRRPAAASKYNPEPDQSYSQAMRLDAIKSDADRRNRQQTEVGLPAFPALQDVEARPLTAAKEEPEYLYVKEDEDEATHELYRDRTPSPGHAADLAGAYPVQTSSGPYQPVFRPSTSAPSQPYAPVNVQSTEDVGHFGQYGPASGFQPGGGYASYGDVNHATEGGAYGQRDAYAYAPSRQPQSSYDQGMYAMPEASPAYQNPGSYGAGRADDHPPYASQPSAALGYPYEKSTAPSASDYVEPFSRPVDEGYGRYAAPTSFAPPVGQGYMDSSAAYAAQSGHRSPTRQVPVYQRSDNYQSPYLPQPESRGEPYIPSAHTATGPASPGSPTSPRGPRPPSGGYVRQ